jgi:hypothetical protein
MKKDCTNCGENFEVFERDAEFYKKFGVPTPDICFHCRLQRRLAFRNEYNLYKDKCDLCGDNTISIFSPDKTTPSVYCVKCYWGDNWDPMDYGMDFDFNRPFFEQIKNLYNSVPHLNLIQLGGANINSEYTHDGYRFKNSYLIFDGEQAEDCYYGETLVKIKDCADFLHLAYSELCYECINCVNCYKLTHSQCCQDCSNSSFLFGCVGVKDSFACANLHQKQYHIFNKPYSKEEYEQEIKKFRLDTHDGLEAFKKRFEELLISRPKKFMYGTKNENVSGDNLNGCKDVFNSFDCLNGRDCSYCTNVMLSANDCYDIDVFGDNLSFSYNSACLGAGANNVLGSYYVGFNSSDIAYSIWCTRGTSNLFGCVGLRKKKYCIFNKKYSQEDYFNLRAKIVEHMKKTGEWGEFFPPEISLFGYNESVAQIYFPLTEEEVKEKGYKWHKEEEKVDCVSKSLPQTSKEFSADLCKEIYACESCKKGYKIIPQELSLLKSLNHPLPRNCFMCRHKKRFSLRTPRRLWERHCDKCGKDIKTAYSPDRPDKIYCEECYQKEVY